jgi:lipoprotein-anchoring transpeptidase ErfK/SrfK
MWSRTIAAVAVLASVGLGTPAIAAKKPAQAPAPKLTLESVNNAEFFAKPAKPGQSAKTHKKHQASKTLDPVVLKAQVLLDRAGFSPGVIDAMGGENFAKALTAFQRQNELDGTGELDEPTWAKLIATSADPVLSEYQITGADVKGPFLKKIPQGLEKMAELDHLSYTSPRELLSEKFHLSESLLAALNPREPFKDAERTIVVTNVPQDRAGAKAAKIEVDKAGRTVRALDQDGKLIAMFPASIGSSEKPAPSGTHKVQAISPNPVYRYDPKFAWKEIKTQKKFTVPSGPNNPVGAVWINLSVPSYGIHGTPNPEKVSKTESHGCIRLTNWDVKALAKMVAKGTPVEFLDNATVAGRQKPGTVGQSVGSR